MVRRYSTLLAAALAFAAGGASAQGDKGTVVNPAAAKAKKQADAHKGESFKGSATAKTGGRAVGHDKNPAGQSKAGQPTGKPNPAAEAALNSYRKKEGTAQGRGGPPVGQPSPAEAARALKP